MILMMCRGKGEDNGDERDDAYYRSGAGGHIDEALEDDDEIIGGGDGIDGDEDQGSDEGEGDDLIENMEE